MAKYCKLCGAPLKNKEGYCAICQLAVNEIQNELDTDDEAKEAYELMNIHKVMNDEYF